MKSDLISQIDQQIAEHEAELKKLRNARTALAGLNSHAGAGARASNALRVAPPAKRAPSGFLEESMTKLLKAHPGLTNGEVRDRLKKSGYAYSLSGLHVGKRLSALAATKQLTVKLDGAKRRYYVAK